MRLSDRVSHWASVEEWRDHKASVKKGMQAEQAFASAAYRFSTPRTYHDNEPCFVWKWVELLRGVEGYGIVCLLGFYARLNRNMWEDV